MVSQADLFGPSIPAAKFLEKNKPVQGVVTREPLVGEERDFKTKEVKVNKWGKPKQQLTVTIRDNDGEELRIYFKGSLLFALKGALQNAGVSEVKEGGTIGAAWTGDTPMDGGFDAKEYTVKYVPPKELL